MQASFFNPKTERNFKKCKNITMLRYAVRKITNLLLDWLSKIKKCMSLHSIIYLNYYNYCCRGLWSKKTIKNQPRAYARINAYRKIEAIISLRYGTVFLPIFPLTSTSWEKSSAPRSIMINQSLLPKFLPRK